MQRALGVAETVDTLLHDMYGAMAWLLTLYNGVAGSCNALAGHRVLPKSTPARQQSLH
jgi:hypothetical protein